MKSSVDIEVGKVSWNVLCVVLSVRVYTEYSSSRASFTEKLQELLGDSYANFDLLSNVEKMSYVLGSEHWQKNYYS